MATMESSASCAKVKRMERILEEAFDRFNHELLPDEERLEILARIKRLKKALAS